MKQIGIKYCGGCNPVIDRARLMQELKNLLPPEFTLADDKTSEPWSVGVLVCGCFTACADQAELVNLADDWIIVAGHSVDYSPMPEKELAEAVRSKIKP